MDERQHQALIGLHRALKQATATGLLDLLQADVASPDSINDVCDAVNENLFELCECGTRGETVVTVNIYPQDGGPAQKADITYCRRCAENK